MSQRPVLLSHDPEAPFPPVAQALRQPDGLLALGGDLSPARLLNAYRSGPRVIRLDPEDVDRLMTRIPTAS